MKKVLLFVVGLLALTACNQKGGNAEDLKLSQQADSLNRIIAQKDNEINDMLGTMNDIEEGSSSRPCSRTANSSASCATSCAKAP